MELDKEYRELLLEEEMEDKLNELSSPQVRLTSLRNCNQALGITYTMTLTQTEIKNYMYYKNKECLFIVWCSNWKDMKYAIWCHKQIERAKSWSTIKSLLSELPNKITIRKLKHLEDKFDL